MKYLFNTLLILLLSNTIHASVGNMQSEDVAKSIESSVVVIDIRTPAEWKQTGTIKKAHRIMFFDPKGKPLVEEFMKEFKKIVTKKNQAVILVCRSGNRTGMVSKYLDQQLGYSNVSHLAKGMKQWLRENRPVDK